MWIIILILSLVAIQLFIIFGLATVRDFRDVRRIEKIFADLIEKGFSEFDALVEVSHKRHPELSLETHRKIATKFCDVDKFFGFINNAVDGVAGKNKDQSKSIRIIGSLNEDQHPVINVIDNGKGISAALINFPLPCS